MSREYTLVHEGLSQWINSPNNGGECCQTWADTVDELNRLLDHIKRLEEAGDVMAKAYRQICYDAYDDQQVDNWFKAKEDKP